MSHFSFQTAHRKTYSLITQKVKYDNTMHHMCTMISNINKA